MNSPNPSWPKVVALLSERKLLMKEGTIVDATIIEAASSTKNRQKERDPQMHQAKKGNQWHFGMKAHIGVDLDSGLVHTVTGTAANVADIAQTHHFAAWGREGGFLLTLVTLASKSGKKS